MNAAREQAIRQAIAESIDMDPERRGGVPVLKGTRFPVGQILAQLAEGDTVDSLAEGMDLDAAVIRKCLDALSSALERPFVLWDW